MIVEENRIRQQRKSILFRHKVVRDLLWVLTSPHMICEHHFPVFPIEFGVETIKKAYPWLLELDQAPTSLIDFLQGKTKTKGKSLALGVYFSALFEFWLLHCPLFQVNNFVAGKQIISSTNQTIGQLKFLFHLDHTKLMESIEQEQQQDKGKQSCDYHVEASVKFFMFHPLEEHEKEYNVTKSFPLEVFVGPHLGENLAWRVQEVDRKLDMCQGEAVKKWLSVKYSDSVQSHIILKGYLFYPLKQFQDTLQVNANVHAWSFLHPCILQESCDQSYDSKPNDHIGKTHLRGWWTCDLAKELETRCQWLPQKQRKYVVLAKLHWLSPTIGYNCNDTMVKIEGEEALGIEETYAMDYQELLAFADQHFQQEEVARNILVMPLLIAELLWIEEHDRWEEVSKGFVVDPKHWNPLPLCKEAVRYRRTVVPTSSSSSSSPAILSDSSDHTMPSALEREYEGRRKWQHGVIKLSEEEKQQQQQQTTAIGLQNTTTSHKNEIFLTQEEIETITSTDLCQRIAQSFVEKCFSYSKWRQTLYGKFEILSLSNTGRSNSRIVIQFVLDMLTHLLEVSLKTTNELTVPLQDKKTSTINTSTRIPTSLFYHQVKEKELLRIGHLVLDALQLTLEQQQQQKREEKEDNRLAIKTCVDFFIDILKDENKWHFLNLTLRTCRVMFTSLLSSLPLLNLPVPVLPVPLEETQKQNLSNCMWKLVQHPEKHRWKFIAVEMCRVFNLYGQKDKDKEERHLFLQTLLVLQKPSISSSSSSSEHLVLPTLSVAAEQFVLDHYEQDMELLEKYIQLLSSAKQWKAIKRFTKILQQQQQLITTTTTSSTSRSSNISRTTPSSSSFSSSSFFFQFPPINHHRQEFTFKSWTWEYIYTKDQVKNLMSSLLSLETTLSSIKDKQEEEEEEMFQDKSIIGIDCEWRPQQFLQAQESSSSKNHRKGVSLYQLSIEKKVFVVDVQLLKEEDALSPLTFILQHAKKLLLVGFRVRGDMQKLTESFPSLKDHLKKSKNCMIELTQIAVARHLFFARTCGLSRLTHECLNEQMDKEQQCSDWGKRPLSQEQLQYAAKDAFMVQQLSLYLLFDIKKPLKLTLSMLKEHFGVFLHQDTSSSSKYHLYLHLPHDHYDPLLHVLTPQGPEQVKEALTKWPILEADSSFHVLSRTSSLSIVLPEGTIVKSIALCIKETFEMTYALVLLRLDHSIDMEALSQLFQVESCSQIGLADQKTLIQVFGYQRGCLGPFGLRKKKNDEQSQNIQIILDERLLKAERILCGAGEQDLVVGVTTTLFIETIEPIVAAISLDKSHVKP